MLQWFSPSMLRNFFSAGTFSLYLALIGNSFGQGYDSGFFHTNSGYPRTFSITFTPTTAPADEQWFSNDPYVVTNILVTNAVVSKGIGDTSLVRYVNGSYTPGASSNGFNSVLFGTYAWSSAQYYDYLPGRTNPSLYKPVLPAVTNTNRSVKFLTEFSIIRSTDVAWPTKDRFGFELLSKSTNGGVTNTNSLARFDFNPNSPVLTNNSTYLFEWRRGGVLQVPASPGLTGQWPLTYGSIYRFTATITGSEFDLDMDLMSSPTGTNVFSVRLVDKGQLAGGFNSTNINTLAVNWQLTSTNPFAPGSKNYLLMNRVALLGMPTPLENWLTAAGWPASTSPTSKPNGSAFSLLEQYAMGASAPGAAFERPFSRRTVASESSWFEVSGVVRTNDPSVTVAAEFVDGLSQFGSPGSVVQVLGDATGVDQTGVSAGCQRQIFRVPVNGASQKFGRLRVRSAN